MEKQTVAVLGPGSWGTALSQVLNDNGHEVRLWGNIQEQIDEINTAHTNQRYFKDIVISDQITATTDLKAALDGVDACLLYTSDAADDLLCVDLGGPRIIKKKKSKKIDGVGRDNALLQRTR